MTSQALPLQAGRNVVDREEVRENAAGPITVENNKPTVARALGTKRSDDVKLGDADNGRGLHDGILPAFSSPSTRVGQTSSAATIAATDGEGGGPSSGRKTWSRVGSFKTARDNNDHVAIVAAVEGKEGIADHRDDAGERGRRIIETEGAVENMRRKLSAMGLLEPDVSSDGRELVAGGGDHAGASGNSKAGLDVAATSSASIDGAAKVSNRANELDRGNAVGFVGDGVAGSSAQEAISKQVFEAPGFSAAREGGKTGITGGEQAPNVADTEWGDPDRQNQEAVGAAAVKHAAIASTAAEEGKGWPQNEDEKRRNTLDTATPSPPSFPEYEPSRAADAHYAGRRHVDIDSAKPISGGGAAVVETTTPQTTRTGGHNRGRDGKVAGEDLKSNNNNNVAVERFGLLEPTNVAAATQSSSVSRRTLFSLPLHGEPPPARTSSSAPGDAADTSNDFNLADVRVVGDDEGGGSAEDAGIVPSLDTDGRESWNQPPSRRRRRRREPQGQGEKKERRGGRGRDVVLPRPDKEYESALLRLTAAAAHAAELYRELNEASISSIATGETGIGTEESGVESFASTPSEPGRQGVRLEQARRRSAAREELGEWRREGLLW